MSWMACSVALAAACDGEDSDPADRDAGPQDFAPGAASSMAGRSGAADAAATTTGRWAHGGTAALEASYPDPFSGGQGSTCEVFCKAMLGPCYAATIERKDISEGFPGLPVRLALRVVDPACEPVPGVSVDIWHTRNTGVYSAEDTGLGFEIGAPAELPPGAMLPANLTLDCHPGDEDSKKHRYFRGIQTTDDNGRVDFDTCYPGWYTGRAVHIHFTLRRDGVEFLTSQLYFPDALTAEICADHQDYAPRGQPNTTNATDGVYNGPRAELDVARQPDGTMLASTTLVLRFSTDDELCGTNGFQIPGAP